METIMKNAVRFKNQEDVNFIINKYKIENLSIHKISKIMKCSHFCIKQTLERNGVNTSKNAKNRKYTLNQNYFAKIDTIAKAYFLGLIYADGCNRTQNNIFEIALSEEDKDILEEFLKEIDCNRPIYLKKLNSQNSNWSNSCRICLCSKIFCKDLDKLGCISKKSLILEFPTIDQVPIHLISHFMRGYFDGDGCISYSNRKSYYKDKEYDFLSPVWSVVGTKNFISKYKNILENELNIKISNIKKIRNIYAITITGKQNLPKLYRWLYNNSNQFFLKRKKEKFEYIVNYYDNKIKKE